MHRPVDTDEEANAEESVDFANKALKTNIKAAIWEREKFFKAYYLKIAYF